MLHKALERAQPGDVMVASVGGYYEAGYWGGLMATSAMAKNLEGLAIDGCIRDSEEIIEMGFPIFCRGFCILGHDQGRPRPDQLSDPFWRDLVNPGDLILGDDDGMVVVERKECETVLEKSIKRIKTEEKKAEQLKAGISSVEINKLDKTFQIPGIG